VIFGENSAAAGGLLLALVCLAMTLVTGDLHWDGVGSLGVGVLLVCVAVFLSIEIKSLLLGEGADPAIKAAIHDVAGAHADVERVFNIITLQQGPGEVMVAVKLKLRSGLDTERVCRAINEVEVRLRERRPEVRWSFIEPDLTDD
jgi:divalent metal cation (Fe/Co/Zn/Cd) transporter